MPNLSMKTGPRGLALIKQWEGLRLTAYKDAVGIWTIGYGSTGSHVKPGLRLTEAEAEALLRKDLARFEKRVNDLVKVPLSQEQFDALVSFDFNTGKLHASTLLKRLNQGEYAAVPSELKRWSKAGGKTLAGLVRRREAEASLWSTAPVPPAPDIEPIEPQPSFWARLLALFSRPAKEA